MLRMWTVCLVCLGAGLFLLLGTRNSGAADEQGTGSALTAQEAEEVVKLHNKARAEVGVAAVKWSPKLAKNAQEWADELAKKGEIMHRGDGTYGENLASGQGYTLLQLVKGWYDEKAKYTPGTPYPGVGFGVGHYTQMVWRDSTEIGVGKAVFTAANGRKELIIFAVYDPPGNYKGEKPY